MLNWFWKWFWFSGGSIQTTAVTVKIEFVGSVRTSQEFGGPVRAAGEFVGSVRTSQEFGG